LPIYEYRCPACGHQFEVMHAVNAAAPKCERCGRPVRRVFSPVGIIFKGPGFHINDYRKAPAPSDGESKKSDTAAAAKTGGDSGATGAAAGNGKAGEKAASKSKSASRSGGGGSKA
jgi:putative FmdB family regulatory protein